MKIIVNCLEENIIFSNLTVLFYMTVLDIPLLPIIGNKEDVESNFRLHWLNNKDLEFTIEAEKLLQQLHNRLVADEGVILQHSSTPNQALSDDENDNMDDEDEEDESKGSGICLYIFEH